MVGTKLLTWVMLSKFKLGTFSSPTLFRGVGKRGITVCMTILDRFFRPTPGQSISDLSVGDADCYEIEVKLKIVDIYTIKDFV